MERDKIDLLFVIVFFEMKECDEELMVVIKGIVSRGIFIGVVDIGVNNVVYFFQVVLFGVSKENGIYIYFCYLFLQFLL